MQGQENVRATWKGFSDWPMAGKLLVLVFVPFGLMLATALFLTTHSLTKLESETGLAHVREEARVISQQFTLAQENLRLTTKRIAMDADILAATQRSDKEALHTRLLLEITRDRISHIQIVDLHGQNLAQQRSAALGMSSVELHDLHTLGLLEIEAVRLVKTDKGWLLVAIEPLKTRQGLVGALSVGRLVDTQFLAMLNLERTNPVVILLDDEGKGTTICRSELQADDFVPDYSLWSQAMAGRMGIGKTRFLDTDQLVAYVPLRINAQPAAVFGVVFSTAETIQARDQLIRNLLVATSILTSGVFLLVIRWVYIFINRPIAQLTAAAQRIAAGDMSVVLPDYSKRDEIGILANAFKTMSLRLRNLLHALETQIDVAQKARVTAEHANQFKSEFLSMISHELRTPLNAILNFTHFLSKERYGSLTEDQQELQQRILFNAQHLLSLINDILDFSKIEAGRLELSKEVGQLDEVVLNVMSTAAGLTQGKPIQLRSELPPDLPPIEMDHIRIRQVLLNLLSNAAKFTDAGSITVRVTQEEHQIIVSVTDTGVGIPADKLDHIFEAFRQADAGMSRSREGTGLGLSISKYLVELHGGRIWVVSTPHVGSTFSFSLPLRIPPNDIDEDLNPVSAAGIQ